MEKRRGGKRDNSGRPPGSGKYKECTKPIRIPLSQLDTVHKLIEEGIIYQLPLYGSVVKAGFPSPADDYIESYLDLNRHLIQHPASTFFVRASGDSMINAGILDGDLLIVDRSIEPVHGKIVIAAINGELTVKRFYQKDGLTQLCPENNNYVPIMITDSMEFFIWGVVLHNIRSF